ncbi:MAG: CCA tRNA nucleotidyltransferase [Clostridiales bacterium]|nr:CCA tRNA nucleotidyltransferase [Clostridiales bacterium]
MLEIQNTVTSLARAMLGAGFALYRVGGCVRDKLLGLPVYDTDVASAMRPEQLLALCAELGIKAALVNERLGTAGIWNLESGICVEHTTFRTESYGEGGAHKPVEVAFTESLAQDAFRRDFSVNALYEDVLTGEITDPTGGLPDLEKRQLRTTTEDPAVILRDDGLRILRLVRFCAQLDFTPEAKTWQAAKEHVSLLSDIAWERKRQELSRILVGPRVLTALQLLRDVGALPYVLPELVPAQGFPQKPEYHKYDVLEHSFHVCAAIAPELPLRLMALLHDVGKPASFETRGNMYDHPQLGEDLCRAALTRLTYGNDLVDRICRAVAIHMYDLSGQAKESTLRKRFARWGRQATQDFIALRQADVRGSGFDTTFTATRWQKLLDTMEAERVPFSENELALSGRDIMDALHLPPGPKVGKIKEQLFLHCAVKPRDNTRERLLQVISKKE